MFAKSLRVAALGLFVAAAMPLAASAISIGVSDEVDTSIVSGHLNTCSSSYSISSGSEWSNLNTSKNGTENDSSSTNSSVSDPASAAGTSSGTFAVNTSGSSGTSGTYLNVSQSASSLTGAQEAQTSDVTTVSAFANP